jgi:hypothetical protein
MEARIRIESDNDISVCTPVGYFPAWGPDLDTTITADTDVELRALLLDFLCKVEIRRGSSEEYDMYSDYRGKDSEVKLYLYEAIHQFAMPHGLFEFYRGGNRVLDIKFCYDSPKQKKK